MKAIFQACWKQSDGREAFTSALKQHGYRIARGDRRGYVATDSRVIIAGNQSDIDFIRSLDTDNLYGENGDLRDDVSILLSKHGYDDLQGKSVEDIRHMLKGIR